MASPPIPEEMHAWTHTSRGSPSQVLHFISNAPVRHPKTSSEVLVKVSYAALNPGSAIMMHLCPFIFRHSPAIPEMDFSGTVVELGPTSETDSLTSHPKSKFKIGDKIFGSIEVPSHIGGGHGALAEYLVVNASHCHAAPEGVKMEELAGLGIAGTTAFKLVNTAKASVGEGGRVLVNGASGGIGTLVVQLMKGVVGENGKVVAVCSGPNRDLVLQQGADEVIDYTAHPSVGNYLGDRFNNEQFDVVIDAIGIQEFWEKCAPYLKPSGSFVTVGIANKYFTWYSMLESVWYMMLKNPFTPVILGGVPRRLERVTAFVNEETIAELGDAVTLGQVKGVVGEIFDMEDVKRAYDVLLRRKARGKIVIRIGG